MSDWIGPIHLYAHDETDEEWEEYRDDILKEHPEWPGEIIGALHYNNPLYEVDFTFYVNPETHEYKITKIDFGDVALTCDLILRKLSIDA